MANVSEKCWNPVCQTGRGADGDWALNPVCVSCRRADGD